MKDTSSYATLAKAKYVNLTTFRKTGEPVGTPIWIAPDPDGVALYGFSGANVGKVKRMRRDPSVTLASCDMRGRPRSPALEGTALLLPAQEAARVEQYLTRKYPLARRLLRWYSRLRGSKGQSAYFEIRLVGSQAERSA